MNSTHVIFTGSTQPHHFINGVRQDNDDGLYYRFAIFMGTQLIWGSGKYYLLLVFLILPFIHVSTYPSSYVSHEQFLVLPIVSVQAIAFRR